VLSSISLLPIYISLNATFISDFTDDISVVSLSISIHPNGIAIHCSFISALKSANENNNSFLKYADYNIV
jgi:hypothetical protein